MSWWNPFSWGKKRDPGDIAEAELLERVKGRLEMARIHIKKHHWAGRKEALAEAEAASRLIANTNTEKNIPNSHYRQQNKNLQIEITGLIVHLQQKIKMDWVGTEYYTTAETLANRIISRLSDFLRQI